MDFKLFVPPVGLSKTMPDDKREDYIKRYKELGPFEKHVYDLDLCVLYRQIDELRARNVKYEGFNVEAYEQQIKEGVAITLKEMNLDSQFYRDHFYFVLNPQHKDYRAYLGLFFSMTDPLSLVPIMHHHLKNFVTAGIEGKTEEDFLNELEYTVCNFIRSNRFPEDYYAKHDKIINWVYGRRDLTKYQTAVDTKIDFLVNALNKFAPSKIPTPSASILFEEKMSEPPIEVVEERREVLFNDLKHLFSQNSHEALKLLLAGKAKDSERIIFQGNASQLVDVFRIYGIEKFIKATKRAIGVWICEHFMYFNDSMTSPDFFEATAVERMIYSRNPLSKDNRINLTGLSKPESSYYH